MQNLQFVKGKFKTKCNFTNAQTSDDSLTTQNKNQFKPMPSLVKGLERKQSCIHTEFNVLLCVCEKNINGWLNRTFNHSLEKE